jgi:hypothetical protein
MKHGNAFHKPKVKWGNESSTSSKLVGYTESRTFTQTMKKTCDSPTSLLKMELFLKGFDGLKNYNIKCQKDSWPLKVSFMRGSFKQHETWKCFSQAKGEMRKCVKPKLKTCRLYRKLNFHPNNEKTCGSQLAC